MDQVKRTDTVVTKVYAAGTFALEDALLSVLALVRETNGNALSPVAVLDRIEKYVTPKGKK